MNTMILVIMCFAEIMMAGKCIIKNTDAKLYTTIRFKVDIGEMLIGLCMLFFKDVSFGLRYNGLFGLLFLRVCIDGIVWGIKRGSDKKMKKVGIVMRAFISILLMVVSLLPSFVFRDYKGIDTAGQYAVNSEKAILIDKSRIEKFENDGSFREIPIYIYYPVVAANEEITFPVVFFSHGAFGYYASNTSTYTELASNGYVVISVEHPYHSIFTKDTDGRTIIVDSDFIQTAMAIQNSDVYTEDMIYDISSEWMELRLDDMNYTIDTVKEVTDSGVVSADVQCEDEKMLMEALTLIDTEKIGVMGHSLGGATAVTLGRTRDDIDAVIDFDGTMLGEIMGVEAGIDIVRADAYDVPLLIFYNEEHDKERKDTEKNGGIYVNNVILNNAKEGFATCIKGSGHMNYTDLPLFSPVLADMLGVGSVDSEQCVVKMNEITVDFFNCYLGDSGEFSVEEYYEFTQNQDFCE